jgi:hypothetical protein
MADNDGYDCFRQLAKECSLLRREQEAREIYDAMVARRPAGLNVPGELGEVLAGLRKTPQKLPANSAALVTSCVQAVQLAVPNYN